MQTLLAFPFNRRFLVAGLCAAALAPFAHSQFIDSFESAQAIPRVAPDEGGGWSWYSGDGETEIDFLQRDGYATMLVDARQDQLNIWWAIIRARIDADLDLQRLSRPDHELRIEARLRVSHAPRRINLQLFSPANTLHQHLAEFDIPTADEWHRVSLTTTDFAAQPGDALFCQLAMMDWGQELHATDVDYIRVDVVDTRNPPPSLGLPLRYHPPLPAESDLPHLEPAQADALIDSLHPGLAISDWGNPADGPQQPRLLAVTPSQTALLRWDLSQYAGRAAHGVATLELTTHSLTRMLGDYEEIGRLRVVEILEQAPAWDETEVTYQSFTRGQGLSSVTNAQMIIDVLIDPTPGARNRIAISQPALQRLIDGESKGLALRALGPINATFYGRENAAQEQAPVLRFALEDPDRANP